MLTVGRHERGRLISRLDDRPLVICEVEWVDVSPLPDRFYGAESCTDSISMTGKTSLESQNDSGGGYEVAVDLGRATLEPALFLW